MKLVARILALSLMVTLLLGFRVYPGQAHWDVSPSDRKIWIEFCEKPDLEKNDLPTDDSYSGDSVSLNDAIDSVIADYNGIGSSYVTFADADRDPEYTEDAGVGRTIEVCFGEPGGVSGGEAAQVLSEGVIVGCNITLLRESLESAKAFVSVLTHELGHCLGLDHPQEVTHAVMSYFRGDDIYRLALDDKAGVIFLYPTDPSDAKEEVTFGTSCSPKS